MPVLDVEKLIENRVTAIRDYHTKAGLTRAQLDVSGGVDSAVMLGILARAVGPDNITAVYSSINSSASSLRRAQFAGYAFNVPIVEINLTETFESLVELMLESLGCEGVDEEEVKKRMMKDPTILGSIRSCIRAPVGRGFNRMTGGGIRHGTGNECEDRWMRFFQKGGDGEVDTNPLAMLSKGEVYQLGIGLGVPDSILKATPSPDLQEADGVGDSDEEELKALTGVDWTYSRVCLEDSPLGDHHRGNSAVRRGEYVSVGTIEKMSRCADYTGNFFDRDRPFVHPTIEVPKFMEITGWSAEEVAVYTNSAFQLERSTRHKMNPNCPSLGNRADLIKSGILTDLLPDFS